MKWKILNKLRLIFLLPLLVLGTIPFALMTNWEDEESRQETKDMIKDLWRSFYVW